MKHTVSYGMKAVLLSVLLLLALVLLNVAVSFLPKSITELDSSYNQLYTLSETTEKQVSTLSDRVTIYFLCDNGTEDATIRTFLDRYAALNGKVEIKTVDPVKQPTFTEKYTESTLSNYSIIVESNRRSVCIDYYDLYLWENEQLGILTAEEYVTWMSDSYGAYILSYYPTVQHFNGEAKITNAITYAVSETVPKIYVLSGHGEVSLGADALSVLKSNAYELVTDTSLFSAGGIPQDCSLLLIHTPTKDISKTEADWIKDYLDNGGSVFLTTAAAKQYLPSVQIVKGDDGSETTETVPSDFPNLMALLANYGLSATNGIVIEQDKNLSYSASPFVLLPNKNTEHAVTSGASGATALFYTAHGIRIAEDAKNVTTLFSTSKSAYTSNSTSTDSYEKDALSEDGPFALAVAAECGKGKLVWFASQSILDDNVDTLVSGGNHAYAVSACDFLTEKEDSVALPSVSLEEPMLVITGNTATLFAVFFCGVIPISVFFGGLLFCSKRRKA